MEHSGRGDPARTLALLWGTDPPSTRGPKPRLSLDQIVAAAVDIADEDGLDNVSMRAVADRLGVGAMSLYTYVPGKAELLDLMLDRVYGELPTTSPVPAPDGSGRDWRRDVERNARANLALYRRHPWALGISINRGTLGPNELGNFEVELAAVAGLGLTAREMTSVVTSVYVYVRGAAQAVVDAEAATIETGITDEEWWAARAPFVEKIMGEGGFPVTVAVANDGGFEAGDDDHPYLCAMALGDFELGLGCLLDGIAALVASRATDDGAP